jgi:hypothetical protein|tara:strand:- start:465 stop:860 length:396 start_codon:yes stop_codon:yes gene_type:complete
VAAKLTTLFLENVWCALSQAFDVIDNETVFGRIAIFDHGKGLVFVACRNFMSLNISPAIIKEFVGSVLFDAFAHSLIVQFNLEYGLAMVCECRHFRRSPYFLFAGAAQTPTCPEPGISTTRYPTMSLRFAP